MFKPKPIAIAASIGFVLSFIIGLCCKVNFGFVVLRAFLFGILSGGICFGVIFVVQKFLKDSDSVAEAPPAESSESSSEIEITEDVLPDDDSSPEFFVSPSDVKPHPRAVQFSSQKNDDDEKVEDAVPVESVSDGESKGSSATSNVSAAKETFRPISLVKETVRPAKETPKPAEAVPESRSVSPAVEAETESEAEPENSETAEMSESPKKTSSLDGVLDELPDFASASSDGDEESSGGDDSGGHVSYSSSSQGSSSGGESISQDSETVAQAIRTMLSRD